MLPCNYLFLIQTVISDKPIVICFRKSGFKSVSNSSILPGKQISDSNVCSNKLVRASSVRPSKSIRGSNVCLIKSITSSNARLSKSISGSNAHSTKPVSASSIYPSKSTWGSNVCPSKPISVFNVGGINPYIVVTFTASKVSNYGVFLGLYFSVFGLNREKYSSPYPVRMGENTDQTISVFRHFSRNGLFKKNSQY